MNDSCNNIIIESNKYYIGDNLLLLKNISNSSIDLIYFDPPYNTGRNFFNFNDKFKSVEDYINFMKERIIECHRCLKPNANIIIHIEPKISHYFRVICDEIFGINNFKNEIVWQTGGNAKKFISTKPISRHYYCLFKKRNWKKCI